ncbi:MAG: sporulation initiation factor Spo0A C-terminal domain-containing protein [Lachnospirales bacterium]
MDVLIAIANEQERRMLEGCFTYEKRVDKVVSFSYGNKALEYYRKNNADVFVMDMILPGFDGISIIEELSRESRTCKTILLSSAKTDNVVSKAFSLGVDYVMVKPYDVNALKRRIFDMNSPGELTNKTLENAVDENYVEKQITAILNGSGIFPNLKGYRYLKCALLLGYKDEEMLDGVTKVLYPKIAKTNNTTSDRVERAIRHAIESAWSKCNGNGFYEKMGFITCEGRRRPTNSEYIFTALEYLKNEIMA